MKETPAFPATPANTNIQLSSSPSCLVKVSLFAVGRELILLVNIRPTWWLEGAESGNQNIPTSSAKIHDFYLQ